MMIDEDDDDGSADYDNVSYAQFFRMDYEDDLDEDDDENRSTDYDILCYAQFVKLCTHCVFSIAAQCSSATKI